MKEKVFVVSAKEEFAQVKINNHEFCSSCSARMLCVGQKDEKGTISVVNPLAAQAGDEVLIEVPEKSYSKELMFMFGVLLSASLLGLAIGYITAILLPLSSTQTSFIGFVLGLILGGFFLVRYFRKIKKARLYPVIIDIIKKGDSNG